jgi:hypothetical protein
MAAPFWDGKNASGLPLPASWLLDIKALGNSIGGGPISDSKPPSCVIPGALECQASDTIRGAQTAFAEKH